MQPQRTKEKAGMMMVDTSGWSDLEVGAFIRPLASAEDTAARWKKLSRVILVLSPASSHFFLYQRNKQVRLSARIECYPLTNEAALLSLLIILLILIILDTNR